MTLTLAQLDVRELDCQKLASIAGADYYEVRQILRVSGEERAIVGRASDWPIISRDARIAELERRVAELEAERAAQIPPAGMPKGEYRPPSDGGRNKRIECAICNALIWPKLFDDHMARHTRIDVPVATDPPEPEPPAWVCAECGATDRRSVAEPSICKACMRKRLPPVRLTPDNPAWRCAEPGCSGAFTRSLTSPDYCTKHAPAVVVNGHQVAA